MIQSLDTATITRYVAKQLNNLLPDVEVKSQVLVPFVNKAIERTEYCFSKINHKCFFDGSNVRFDHLHTEQYTMFLYYLSNTIWRQKKDDNLASKIYCLNKALNGISIFYKVALPDIFFLTHSVGTVLGRAEYNDYFVATQRVTIGANKNLEYPVLGKGVAVYGGSAVIGKCKIGNNCLISINTVVMEKDIPDNMVVFGKYPNISYKETRKSVVARYFIS
ncbi:MAG: LbetaH domain-containing protein [Planctomycetota bacterium]|jgi:serine O-acetyltransferase